MNLWKLNGMGSNCMRTNVIFKDCRAVGKHLPAVNNKFQIFIEYLSICKAS